MADKWDSHLFRRLSGAFAGLLFDDARQVFTTQKGIDGAALVIDPPMASIVDVIGADTYICEAPAGTASSAPGWRIQKITVSGGTTSILWANGGRFDQVADNRASMTFS